MNRQSSIGKVKGMNSMRLLAVAALVATVACFSAPAPVSARAHGGFSINTTGPITISPESPGGGVNLCIANLRKFIGTDTLGNPKYLFHRASGYSFATCQTNAAPYISNGYVHNPVAGTGYCQCYPGFDPMVVGSPYGTGPITASGLSREQIQIYDEGVRRLREEYDFATFVDKHEELLRAIEESMPAKPEAWSKPTSGR